MNYFFILWIIIFFISIIFELISPGFFFFLSFAIGAITAGAVSLFTFDLVLQISIFLFSSLLSFFLLKSWVQKKLHKSIHKTNIDALLGAYGFVIEEIGKTKKGHVRINGEIWSASTFDTKLEKGSKVEVINIKGNHIIVRRINENSEI